MPYERYFTRAFAADRQLVAVLSPRDDSLYANDPVSAARKFFFRLDPATRSMVASVQAEAYVASQRHVTYPRYHGPPAAFSVAGWAPMAPCPAAPEGCEGSMAGPDHLGRTLATGGRLRFLCADCGHSGEMDKATALRIFGEHATPNEVRAKLRCSKCGSRRCEAIV